MWFRDFTAQVLEFFDTQQIKMYCAFAMYSGFSICGTC